MDCLEPLALIFAAMERRQKEQKALAFGLEPLQNAQTPAVQRMTKEAWDAKREDIRSLCGNLLSFAQYNKYLFLAGLAANQMGLEGERVNLDVCFVNTSARCSGGEGWVVALCPEIVSLSGGTVSSREGCLTWPGKIITADRHDKVVVRFRELDWVEREMEASGFVAKVWQHEVNHLRGVEERVHTDGEFRGVGRNDPCPCGSGKKLKKCCGL